MRIQIEQIKINPGRREASPEHIEELVKSITEVGLLNPITVDRDYTLIAGLHRLEAARKLGWTEIECTVSSLEGLQRELAEIDENFVRRDIDVVDYGDLLLRRKELYEALHPEVKNGGDRRSEDFRTNKVRSEKSFVQDTADKLGVVPRTIEKQIQTARNLTPEAKEILRHTGITKKGALALSRLSPEKQREAAQLLASGKVRTPEEYLLGEAASEESLESTSAAPVPLPDGPAPEDTSEGPFEEEKPAISRPTVPPSEGSTEDVVSRNPALNKFPPDKAVPVESFPMAEEHIAKHDICQETDAQGNAAEDDPPFSLGGKTFATVRDSIADLKDPNKDCSARPDTFLAEINAFVEKFDEEVDWFRNPYYLTAISKLSQVQFEYFSRRMETICGIVKQIIQYVEGEWSKHE